MATSDWNINTDIYDIVDSLKNLQKKYIEDEDETTLSLGIFGFTVDTEAKKIQTATIMAGQLGNEMFPTRAILTKNILTHAAYNGITDVNAVPATMNATICVKVSDILKYINSDNSFILDASSPIFIGEYEFHLDYDVKVKRKKVGDGYSYSAQYILEDENDIDILNPISDILNPYITQPFILNIGNEEHVALNVTIRQCSLEEITDSMTSDSIIENKSYTFSFDNQLAAFNVEVTTDGITTQVIPYMYGSTIDPSTENPYCWYMFTGENEIRIEFDSTSYIPGLNSQVYIKIWNTLGADGNFEYLNIDNTSEGIDITMDSDRLEYYNLICYLVALTDSVNGSNKKSKSELQELIPKAAMSRGNITTETDLNNYFNLINTDINRIVMRKKVDNQLNRIWFSYFLLKDDLNNIIPSNTINLKLTLDNSAMQEGADGRWIVPAGTYFRLSPSLGMAEPIDAASIPEFYTDDYFNDGYYYYINIYTIALDTDPLYSSYYLTTQNYNSYFLYDYVCEDSDVQFIANRFHFERNLIVEQDHYRLTFSIARSINDENFNGVIIDTVTTMDEEGNKTIEYITTQNLKVVLVIYKDGNPYRWMECPLTSYDTSTQVYSFEAVLYCNNEYDSKNCVRIEGFNDIGTTSQLYGYLPENVEASIYILANIEKDSEIVYPRYNLDSIAPGYEDMVITNIYKCISGIDFFKNYTGIINTRVDLSDGGSYYKIKGVPCIGAHYIQSNTEAKYVSEAINEKKSYIDYCLDLVEQSIGIDFKFFNTYGPSLLYTLEDKETSIGHVDLELRFKVSLKDTAEVTTIDDLKNSIKEYIEDISNIQDFHAPNLITAIENEYSDRIYYIEFVGFNTFDEDDQHIIDTDDDTAHTIPEFINVRNTYDAEFDSLVPMITIDQV